MSDISHKTYIFSLKSVVAWSVGPFPFQAPNRPEKKNKKMKFYQAIRNQNQTFHGFNLESTTEALDRNFALDFELPNLRYLQKTYEIRKTETREILEVSGKNKSLFMKSFTTNNSPQRHCRTVHRNNSSHFILQFDS
jgi:hypothetical protein